MQGSTGPRDVARCIDVGKVAVTTLSTSRIFLVNPVTRVDEETFGARLARKTRTYSHYCPTGALSLVGQ